MRYTVPVGAKRPGIVSANRPRNGSFASLLDLLPQDDDALDGLASSYAELPVRERPALIRAVVQDATSPTQALMAMLAVEDDPRLCRRLAGLIDRQGRFEQRAYLRGGASQGEASLVQSLPGTSAEALNLSWKHCMIEQIEIEPRIALDFSEPESPVSVAEAIDTLAPLLWRHLRGGGRLPPGAERFAGFFSVA